MMGLDGNEHKQTAAAIAISKSLQAAACVSKQVGKACKQLVLYESKLQELASRS